MFRFVLGMSMVYGALLAWALLAAVPFVVTVTRSGNAWLAPSPVQLTAVLVGLPLVCAWVCLEVVQRFTPRTVFDARVRRPVAPFAGGVIAGLIGVVLTAAAIGVVDAYVPDAAVVSAGAVLGSLAALLFMSRRRAHECVHCGYDLSSSGAVCPECGAAHSRGAEA